MLHVYFLLLTYIPRKLQKFFFEFAFYFNIIKTAWQNFQ